MVLHVSATQSQAEKTRDGAAAEGRWKDREVGILSYTPHGARHCVSHRLSPREPCGKWLPLFLDSGVGGGVGWLKCSRMSRWQPWPHACALRVSPVCQQAAGQLGELPLREQGAGVWVSRSGLAF